MNLQLKPVKVVAILLLLALFVVTGRGTCLRTHSEATPDEILALELAGPPADAAAVIRSWRVAGGEAAIAAARTSIRWDNAFIPCYVALYLILCVWAARKLDERERRRLRAVIALPVLAGLLDGLENAGMTAMLDGAPVERWSRLVAVAASFKFLALGIATVFILASFPAWVRSWNLAAKLTVLRAGWVWLVRFAAVAFHVLNVCRWSLLGLTLALLLLTTPGQDLFRGLDRPGDLRWWLLLGAALLWATNLWYWARVLLSLRLGDQVDSRAMQGLATWIPRALGSFALGLVATAIALASRHTDPPARTTLLLWSGATYVLAAVFLAVVILRRRAGRAMQLEIPPEPEVDTHPDWVSLPRGPKRFLAAFVGGAIVLLTLFWLSPQWGPRFGTITIVLLAASLWVGFGSVATYFSLTRRIPSVVLLLLWTIAISPLTDNRALETQPRVRSTPRPLLDSYLQQRLTSLPVVNGRRPVYLITAEGGGIRAAYWTASVLGQMQDMAPSFFRHVAGVSAVSGGSVGAAVFVALLADGDEKAKQVAKDAPPERTWDCPAGTSAYRCAARAILSHDYLAADLAALLFPDLLQRFIPFPLPGTDRARAFERAWRAEWALRTGNQRMSQPFEQLWGGDVLASPLPALFLNATEAESGARVVWSPIRFDQARVPDLLDGPDLLSGGESVTVSLATAAHASARYPYISPAGRVARGHVVDGGYFENSGAATGLQVLAVLARQPMVQPIVIAIVNSLTRPARDPDALANDLLAPPRTLFRTRDARGTHSESVLERAVRQQGGCMIRLEREPGGIEPPLSWVLSASAQNELDRQLGKLESTLKKALAPLSGGTSPCAP